MCLAQSLLKIEPLAANKALMRSIVGFVFQVSVGGHIHAKINPATSTGLCQLDLFQNGISPRAEPRKFGRKKTIDGRQTRAADIGDRNCYQSFTVPKAQLDHLAIRVDQERAIVMFVGQNVAVRQIAFQTMSIEQFDASTINARLCNLQSQVRVAQFIGSPLRT